MKAYRAVNGDSGFHKGDPIISDGYDICLTPAEARDTAAELIEAADRADRGEFDYYDRDACEWRRLPPTADPPS